MVNNKLTIQEVLDLINEEYGYHGLSNESVNSTDERDDLVSRSLFNKYKNRYNKESGKQIQPIKVNQKLYLYEKEDIIDLIDYFDKHIVKVLHKKTIDFSQHISEEVGAFGFKYEPKIEDKYKRIAISTLNIEMNMMSEEEIERLIEENRKKILSTFVDMKKVNEDAVQLIVDGQTNYSREDYLK